MKLWIRSQNKELFLEVNMVYIDEHNNICDGRTNVLGKYKTKKRALEVLNGIQEEISNGEFVSIGYEFNYCTKSIVYEMPEE
jgi:hypothetical protein